MAEAVATLSLVANILQMLDYGRKFVGTAWGIWRGSADDKNAGSFTDAQRLAADLKTSLCCLNDQQPGCDEEIARIADECIKISDEMLEGLGELALAGSRGKREAAKAAFKRMWNKDEIEGLGTRLEGFREQLMLRLMLSLR
jgi:hypothetical protein